MNFRSVPLHPLLLLTILWGCGETPPAQAPESSTPIAEGSRRPEEGAVHLVRLVQRGDQYAFEPAEIDVQSGDVVRFVLAGPQPESVAFDTAAAIGPPANFIRENSLHLGVLLLEPGQAYDVSFQDAPPGSYPYFSIPHAVQGMRGAVEVR